MIDPLVLRNDTTVQVAARYQTRVITGYAYKERNTNSAPKIRLATMASNKARDGHLSPRALVMWLVIMTPAVSAIQSQNIPAPS
jgi:hypothetical protein